MPDVDTLNFCFKWWNSSCEVSEMCVILSASAFWTPASNLPTTFRVSVLLAEYCNLPNVASGVSNKKSVCDKHSWPCKGVYMLP